MHHDPAKRLSCSPSLLQLRADILKKIRDYFIAQNVLEVETPSFSRWATFAANLDSFKVNFGGENFFLHTSPEYTMKYLLAEHRRDIYQICKVYRANEVGRFHNPEFTMLEWYRLNQSYEQLMTEALRLLTSILATYRKMCSWEIHTYQNLFEKTLHIDPMTVDTTELKQIAREKGIVVENITTLNEWLDLLMTHVVAPQLKSERLTAIYGYPVAQAELAETSLTDPKIAKRFEIYFGQMELANGCQELTDSQELHKRFEHENMLRKQSGKNTVDLDARLVQAHTPSFPICAGIAVGLDRLVMCAANWDHIEEVISVK